MQPDHTLCTTFRAVGADFPVCFPRGTWTWIILNIFCLNLTRHFRSKWVPSGSGRAPIGTQLRGHLQCCVSNDALLQLRSLFFSLPPLYSVFNNIFFDFNSEIKLFYATFPDTAIIERLTTFYVLFLWYFMFTADTMNYNNLFYGLSPVRRRHKVFAQSLPASSIFFFSFWDFSMCTQHCSLMPFYGHWRGITYANSKNGHVLSTSKPMSPINIRTQMQTILQFKKASWIWRRVYLENFLRTNSRKFLRRYWWVRSVKTWIGKSGKACKSRLKICNGYFPSLQSYAPKSWTGTDWQPLEADVSMNPWLSVRTSTGRLVS